jgi:hypothetical protein
MIIRKAKRSKTSFCRICGKVFERGEKYIALNGTFRVMRALMCIDHFNIKDCEGCVDRLKCLTQTKQTICINGSRGATKAEEK